jgi:endonuclease/exonuclease/phosphatase family metal-dependent hydrolase
MNRHFAYAKKEVAVMAENHRESRPQNGTYQNGRSYLVRIRRTLSAWCLIVAWLTLNVNANNNNPDPLLEVGSPPNATRIDAAPTKIKIVSYNIRFRSGQELKKLIELFKSDAEIGKAAILGLQEVDRNRKRTNHTNTARLMAESLGLHYAWAAPPTPNSEDGEEETGVSIMSIFPLADVTRIVLPHDGPGGRRRVALGATVKVADKAIRIYSLHGETRIDIEKKLEQYSAILDDLKKNHPGVGRVIVVGDFNSWEGSAIKGTTKLFDGAGFATPFSTDEKTFRWLFVKLKLDWMWLRGLEVAAFGIDRKIKLSDHWPMWVEVKM